MVPDYTATLPAKRSAAAVLFTDGDGRVLLVEPTYKPDWEIPGGTVERNESPRAAAAREIEEELGLRVAPGRLLVVDWVPPRGTRTEGLMFVFAGEFPGDAVVRLPPDELRSWAWCGPDEVDTRMAPQLARRVRAASRALATGHTLYLEFGETEPDVQKR
ncbi:NUDIX domain-containing protein [Cryptosporangium arvum]|uniref:NUDIX domain-containing protein n=1 Tax=Cryptosporangium arvum TaxID=80871 RepID=UPI0004B9EDB6|nr:NUDIX hydrolase [Cryptosporangium arvum]